VLVRAHSETKKPEYLEAAQRAFASFLAPVAEGGVSFTDSNGDLWFEEYIVSPPTHILNGFIWAAWGVHDFYLATGTAIGMKPAGGIKNAKQALHYLVAVKETLGDTWLNSSRYRFGASSLLNDLLRQIEKEKTGAYQAPYYFTEASESY